MKRTAVLGVVLMVVGVLVLAYQGITYTTRETVFEVGPLQATADREKTLALPRVLGLATFAGGATLLIVGMRRRA